MKKLLIVAIVLGLTSLAQASLDLTINGEAAPSEITIEVSQNLEVDIEVSTGVYNQVYDVVLVLSNAQAEWIEPYWVDDPFPADGHWEEINFPTTYTLGPSTVKSSSSSVIRLNGAMASADYAVGGDVIMNELYLHCVDSTNLILTLEVYDADGMQSFDGQGNPITYTDGQILGQVTIHQIPEPMTIALLGLGGLFLRRRK